MGELTRDYSVNAGAVIRASSDYLIEAVIPLKLPHTPSFYAFIKTNATDVRIMPSQLTMVFTFVSNQLKVLINGCNVTEVESDECTVNSDEQLEVTLPTGMCLSSLITKLTADYSVSFVATTLKTKQLLDMLLIGRLFLHKAMDCPRAIMFKYKTEDGSKYGVVYEENLTSIMICDHKTVNDMSKSYMLGGITRVEGYPLLRHIPQFPSISEGQIYLSLLHDTELAMLAFYGITPDITAALSRLRRNYNVLVGSWSQVHLVVMPVKELPTVIESVNFGKLVPVQNVVDGALYDAFIALCGDGVSKKAAYMLAYNIKDDQWSAECTRLKMVFNVDTEEEVIDKLHLLIQGR